MLLLCSWSWKEWKDSDPQYTWLFGILHLILSHIACTQPSSGSSFSGSKKWSMRLLRNRVVLVKQTNQPIQVFRPELVKKHWSSAPFYPAAKERAQTFCAHQFPLCSIQYLSFLLQFWKAALSIGSTSFFIFLRCSLLSLFCNIFKLIPNRFRVSLEYEHRRHRACLSGATAHVMVSYLVRKANGCWFCFNRSEADTSPVPFVLHFTSFWACREGKKTPNKLQTL